MLPGENPLDDALICNPITQKLPLRMEGKTWDDVEKLNSSIIQVQKLAEKGVVIDFSQLTSQSGKALSTTRKTIMDTLDLTKRERPR